MSRHRPHLFSLFHVPDLHITRVETDGEVAPVGGPGNGRDGCFGGTISRVLGGLTFPRLDSLRSLFLRPIHTPYLPELSPPD